MSEVSYVGEHLWPGVVGHLFLVTGFVAALLSAISMFIFHTNKGGKTWYSLGKNAFLVHGISILLAIGLMFYMMISKMYEYHYVWNHVSDDLPFRYIFSAFWEGQEGSFLLWMFWHIVLGFVILYRRNKWTAGVIGTLAIMQFFLASMILGVYVMGHKFGSSPFVLLRDVMNIPLFANAEYLQLIDGNGLNPLLQNYWNTIHPPTTFLGFASLSIPYAFAISGLMAKDKKGWVESVLPWGLFSGAMLGTGILMGAAWAYEALSFGGYWSWDPVENSSLVPWLIMIAGIHTNVIAKSTGRSVFMTYGFYLFAFVLIVYSTFLTRSGILGDTSVHAFTEMGLEWQLIIFLAFFSLLGLILLFLSYKDLREEKEEEHVYSREFWMFIGSLVLLFSAVLILFTTSIPVYNKLFDAFGVLIGSDMSHMHRSSPLEPIEHYNRYQLWIAVFIGFLSGISILLRYFGKNWKTHRFQFLREIVYVTAISSVISLALSRWINLPGMAYAAMLFAAVFTICANALYLWQYIRFQAKKSASTFSHVGFGLLVIGIMASGLNKSYISTNPFAQRGLIDEMSDDRLSKNITLIKGAPMFMNDHWVTYVSDTMIGNLRKYMIHYRKVDSTGANLEEFVLRPQVVYDNKVSKVASVNPATKRYWNKDIFTHITSIPPQLMDVEMAQKIEDSLTYVKFDHHVGDTFELEENLLGVISSISQSPQHEDYEQEEQDIAFGVNFEFFDIETNERWTGDPIAVLRGNLVYKYSEQINPLKLRIEVSDDIFNVQNYDQDISWSPVTSQVKQPFTAEGFQITIRGFSENINHPSYEALEGDIAVSAQISVEHPDGQPRILEPVYVIRENQQFSLNAYDPFTGLHIRIVRIDPQTGNIELNIAQGQSIYNSAIPFTIAQGVPRTDYIVMEAIEFPGINLVWLGSCLMMLGMFIGMADRRKRQYS